MRGHLRKRGKIMFTSISKPIVTAHKLLKDGRERKSGTITAKMKKTVITLMAVIFCFSISACGKDGNEQENNYSYAYEEDKLSDEEITQTIEILSAMGYDGSKDSDGEGAGLELPAAPVQPESIGGDCGNEVRVAVSAATILAGDDLYSRCRAIDEILRKARNDGYVDSYKSDYINGIVNITYPNGDAQSFYVAKGMWN